MSSGKEKWALGSLAVGGLLAVVGLVAVILGVVFNSISPAADPVVPQALAQVTTETVAAPATSSAPVFYVPEELMNPQPAAAPAATAAAPAGQTAAAATPAPLPPPPVAIMKPEEAMKKLLTPEQEKEADDVIASLNNTDVTKLDYERARWHPIHQKPAIIKASNETCLKCHQEVLTKNTRDTAPAGLQKVNTLAWYQTLDTYQGDQLTFHQRHLTAPFIKTVANMSCSTCHQGNNVREETNFTSSDVQDAGLTMRKMVNPQVCLMCHGQFPYQNMGLTGPWHESGASVQNNCLLCHAAIRTTRHQVNFLKADAIEKEGAANSDSCYGCHGGRSWYRISFPYPRHAWQGATPAPDWAKDRPTESDLRFLIQNPEANPASDKQAAAAPATQTAQ